MKYRINLPKTSFSMKANLREKEPQIVKFWDKIKIYDKLQKKNEKNSVFMLHDGPPYANGKIHLGHVLNKILKDIIIKYKNMDGKKAPFVPGWDCHGLPIEYQLLKELGKNKDEINKISFRRNAKNYALKFVKIQRDEFKRLGVFADWENPYLTLDPKYEGKEIETFAKLVEKGYVYHGKKPVLWCARCETSLAEAEIEYKEKTSPSIFVKFSSETENYSIVIWTTTPWTLPANLALAVNPSSKYLIIETDEGKIVIAKEREEELKKLFNFKIWNILEQHSGSYFAGKIFKNPLLNRNSIVIGGDFVSMEEGTGIVHIAPGHGEDDYQVGLKNGLDVFAPVDEKGRFTQESQICVGEFVFDANQDIIEKLKQNKKLIFSSEIIHSYPHCWRCKSPVIFRATEQWFIDVKKDDLIKRLITATEKVKWIPEFGKNRIQGMLEDRPDWCLSRQRYWGVPIPAFYCKNCGEVFLDTKIINHIAKLFYEHGSNIWFEKNEKELLFDDIECKKCGSREFKKENDIFDVWFDSGVSHYSVLKQRENLTYPATMYLEGSDQHRGWFQTSLIPTVILEDNPPYKIILTHGFVVDGEGKKMSKSLGNVMDPHQIINKLGADILRLWVASEDYKEDLRISDEILKILVDSYRKIRNTIRFLLGNIHDFDDTTKIPYSNLREVDYYIINITRKWYREIRKDYENFDFHRVYHKTMNFINRNLSSFYLDILKDRLYTYSKNHQDRRSAQTALQYIFIHLVKGLAPILSFTCEEAWQHYKYKDEERWNKSLFEEDFETEEEIDENLLKKWEKIFEMRNQTLLILERMREKKIIGNSLEADIFIYSEEPDYREIIESLRDYWYEIFIVSNVYIEKKDDTEYKIENEKFFISARKTPFKKCPRCWMYKEEVKDENSLCRRCKESETDISEK